MVLRFGVIGTNWITSSFIDSAQSTGDWSLTGVYSRTSETATAFASKHGLDSSKCYTSLDTLCRAEDIDAVYIASPNALHLAQATTVLRAGKHAIVEKPAVLNSSEFASLTSVAEEAYAASGAVCIEAYRHLQEANYATARSALSSLGGIKGASVTFCQYSSRIDAVYAGDVPNVFSTRFGGGCLVDMGVYPIAFVVGLFGRPLGQTYHAQLLPTDGCADGAGLAVLEYDGFVATCHAAKTYSSTLPTEIYGDKGTLVVGSCTDIKSVVLRDSRGKTAQELAKPAQEFNLAEEAAEFHRLITQNDKSGIDALWEISQIVVDVTTDLRKQAGIVFDSEN